MRKNLLLLVFLGAGFITVIALGASVLSLLLPLLMNESIGVDDTTSALGLLALALFAGLPLCLTSLWARQEKPARPFRIRLIWLGIPLFVLTIAIGEIIINLDIAPALLLPPWHLVGIAIPPFIIITAIAQHLSNKGLHISWREIISHVTAGAFVATFVSLVLESIGMVFTVILIALSPGGLDWLSQTWQEMNSTTVGLGDPEMMAEWLSSPWGVFALLLTVSVAAPLIEEMIKPWAAVVFSGRRPSSARAFLWGISAGAGFSLTEGLFNTSPSVGEWGVMVSARMGATAMHCLAAGIVAWGWIYARNKRRWFALPLNYLGAVSLHALWNASIIGLGLLALQFVSDNPEDIPIMTMLGVLGLLGVLGFLVILAPSLLFALTWRFARQIKAKTPLSISESGVSDTIVKEVVLD